MYRPRTIRLPQDANKDNIKVCILRCKKSVTNAVCWHVQQSHDVPYGNQHLHLLWHLMILVLELTMLKTCCLPSGAPSWHPCYTVDC